MAVTFDFGKCAACGESNSKTIQQCRSCSATLPWAKAAAPAKAKGPGFSLGDVAWGPISVQILGGIIFVLGAFLWCGNVFRFFPTIPLAGYFTMMLGGGVFRAGVAMD